MSSSTESSWQEVNRDLNDLARELGATQSPMEAQFHAALDELARGPLPAIPTEAEAVEWATGRAEL